MTGPGHTQQRPHRRPSQGNGQAISFVIFIRAGDANAASFYPPPAVTIPVTGPLTVERFIAELRSRPNVRGMRDLEVDPGVPIQQLLRDAPRLFRELRPFLSPTGTRIIFHYGPGMPTPAQLQFNVERTCPEAILVAPRR
jgi:hypothetical protein